MEKFKLTTVAGVCVCAQITTCATELIPAPTMTDKLT